MSTRRAHRAPMGPGRSTVPRLAANEQETSLDYTELPLHCAATASTDSDASDDVAIGAPLRLLMLSLLGWRYSRDALVKFALPARVNTPRAASSLSPVNDTCGRDGLLSTRRPPVVLLADSAPHSPEL